MVEFMKRYIKSSTYLCIVRLADYEHQDFLETYIETTADTEAKACNNAKYRAREMYPHYYVTSVNAQITNDRSGILPKDSDRQTFCPRCDAPLEDDGRCPECGEYIFDI